MDYFIAWAKSAPTLDSLLGRVYQYIINPAILLLFTVATVLFFWGVIVFIRGSNDKTQKEQGQQHMLWGIVGFVIMVGVYGIINFFMQLIGVTNIKITPTENSVGTQKVPEINIPNFTSTSGK